jgi:hypothetical protein
MRVALPVEIREHVRQQRDTLGAEEKKQEAPVQERTGNIAVNDGAKDRPTGHAQQDELAHRHFANQRNREGREQTGGEGEECCRAERTRRIDWFAGN